MNKARKRLGEILVDLGLVKEETVLEALERQKTSPKKIGEILVEMGSLTERELVRALAAQCGLPFEEKLSEAPTTPELMALIPLEFMERHRVAPVALERNGRLKVATTNPMSLLFVDSLKLALKLEIDLVFTYPEELSGAIAFYERTRHYFPESSQKHPDPEARGEGDDAVLIRIVEHLITGALRKKASDIHLESSREGLSVRYRIDGILHETEAPQRDLAPQVISRIKVMAGLDLAEKRLPQDGRIQLEREEGHVDLRVSILPSLHGESVVLRILKEESLKLGFGELGMSSQDERIFRSLLSHPHGMIFVTGPTGSGKTTTLYAALEILNEPSEKIITVEDPVEYELDGVNQVQVKAGIGLTFAHTLRAILRQAPSVILVGEIRDAETAEVAVQAALTGHLVFSTLHTNDAVSSVWRLIDLGIRPYLVSAATEGVIAQRLVRRICENCKERIEKDAALHALFTKRGFRFEEPVFYRGRGCSKCSETGYLGRIAIFEILLLDEDLRKEIALGNTGQERLLSLVRERGMKSLFEDGLEKAAEGLTTVEEVLRVVEAGEVSRV